MKLCRHLDFWCSQQELSCVCTMGNNIEIIKSVSDRNRVGMEASLGANGGVSEQGDSLDFQSKPC